MNTKKYIVGLALVSSFFLIGTPALAAGLTEAQIQAILSLLSSFGADSAMVSDMNAVMHGQTVASTAAPAANCVKLSNNLYADITDSSTDGEVSKLQQFLGGRVTGYFGPLTLQLVQNWQKMHGVVSSGSPDTTGYGYAGPKTRASMSCASNPVSNTNAVTPNQSNNPRIQTATTTIATSTPSGTIPATPATPAQPIGQTGTTTVPATPAIPASPTPAPTPPTTPPVTQYTITVTQGANGTISPGTTSVISGGSQTFTITSASGYQIASVTVDGTNQGVISTYAFTNVVAAHTITATFIAIPVTQYAITVTQATGGTISPGTTSVTSGGNRTFTVTPISGYQISNLIVDGSIIAYANTYTFTNITTPRTFSAVFSIATPAPQFLSKWGTAGSSDGQFNEPGGVAVDSSGNVYVADGSNHRIQKFSSSGAFLTKWGTYGSGDGQFNVPRRLAVDGAGNVYVADSQNHRIQKFSSSGAFLTKWGTYGSGDGQFNEPGGVAVDSSGNVYVADTDNYRIQKFSSDGAFLANWGSAGTGDNQFRFPNSLAVDAMGNVYVGDLNHRILKFSSNGTFIAKWGSQGDGDGQFLDPGGVALDTAGNIYVADTENERIQKFSSTGTFLTKWGTAGSGDGQFLGGGGPRGIAVSATGNIYVVDYGNNRIQVFSSVP